MFYVSEVELLTENIYFTLTKRSVAQVIAKKQVSISVINSTCMVELAILTTYYLV